MELKEQIERFVPFNEQEQEDKAMMIEYMNTFKDVLTREIQIEFNLYQLIM